MGDSDPGLGRCDGLFPIFRQSSASAKPCEGALHDPATRQGLEALGLVGPLDNLESERSDLLQCALQLRSGTTTVGEDMPQPRPALENGFEDGRRAVAILNIGAVNRETDHQSERVDDDMTLASLNLLSRVIARNSAAFRGFHALTVDHASGRPGFSTYQFTRRHHKMMVDPAP